MNIENPIQFLEDIAENNQLLSYYNEFIKDAKHKFNTENRFDIEYPQNSASYFVDDERREFIIIGIPLFIGEEVEANRSIISFIKDYLPKKLNEEKQKSKSQISSIIFTKIENANLILKGIVDEIQFLKKKWSGNKSKWVDSNLTDDVIIDEVFDELLTYIARKIESNILIHDEANNKMNNSKAPFNIKKGNKTDLVKLLNSLYDLGYFIQVTDNEPITKKTFMEYFGLGDYGQTLNQSFKADKDKFLEVFDKLRNNASLTYEEMQEKAKK